MTITQAPVVGRLPVRQLSQVMHLGTMEASNKGSFSYEGHGLSVSTDPELWVAIAELGGNPCWQLSNKQGRFLEAHDLSDTQREGIEDWSIEAGLATRVDAYQVPYEDTELGEEMFMLFTDRRLAVSEVEANELDTEIIETQILRGTSALVERLAGMEAGDDCFEQLLGIYVEENTHLDGVWWEDEVAAMSAPRGVIIPSKLSDWQTTEVEV